MGLPYGVSIKLSDALIAEATELGRMRQDAAANRGRTNSNNLTADYLESERIHVVGALAECAAAWWLAPRFKWNRFTEKADLSQWPDLTGPVTIDVKAITQRNKHLLVDEHGNKPAFVMLTKEGGIKPTWFYLAVVTIEHPVYWLAGFVRGDAFARCPIVEAVPGRRSHVIAFDDLTDAADLGQWMK